MYNKDIIKNLYRGNIKPNEVCFKKDSPIAIKLEELNELEEKIIKTMNSDWWETVNEYTSKNAEITEITAEQSFTKGFQLAVRLMIEAMSDDKCDFKEIAKK